MVVWVLKDERIGSSKQAIALAEMMGWEYETKVIDYTMLAKLPNYVPYVSPFTVKKGVLDALTESGAGKAPDIMIAAGRRAARVMYHLKSQYYHDAKLVQILNPQMNMSRFDLVLLPHHDNISGRAPHNVLRIDGAVTHIKPESLEQAAQRWVADWSRLPECKIAVLVGGDTSKHKIGRGDIVELMGHCERIATATNGCLMVTNSRRTSAEANQALVQCLSELQVPYYCYDCNTGGDNPYMGLLAHSSYIVTTGDSISMCAESVASGKPTFIYAKKEGVGKKHWRFIEKLIALGRAKLLKNFAPGMIMVDQQASNELKQSVIARLHQASKTT